MKEITSNWTQQQRDLNDHETPFLDIDLVNGETVHNVRLYRTKGGSYGPQVVTIIRHDVKGHTRVFASKTNGCGYNKTAEALTDAFHALKVSVPGFSEGSDSLPHENHIGGNYYKISVEPMK